MHTKRENSSSVDTTPAPPISGPALVAGRFEILALVGRGGMASVYRARDTELDETVALKVISRELAADEAAVERFRREVKLARRVTHRNVARSFDIGTHGGQVFLTMELVEGESLSGRLARMGRMSEAETIAIALEVCSGLEAAHAAGIVHRDLKPDNVMIANDGRVVLTDFGIARAELASEVRSNRTVAGIIVGTAEYIAPEQVQGAQDLDGRADIYALGAMMFELVTGTPAWTGETPLATVIARLSSAPPDPRERAALSDALAAIITACMARRREDRPASAAAVGQLLFAIHDPGAPQGHISGPPPTSGVVVFARGEDESSELLASGLSDLVERHLRGGTTVRIPAVPRSFRITSTDSRSAAARALRAATFVEARVSGRGDRLIADLEVVRVEDESVIYRQRYDVQRAELFTLAAQVASDVADHLDIPHRPTLPGGPRDAGTVDLWLRARACVASGLARARDEAVVLLEQAVTRSPDEPWLLASYATTLVARFRSSGTSSDDLVESEHMASDVVARAPMLGEAWLARALARLELGQFRGAASDLAHARRTMSPSADLHAALGRILLGVGAAHPAEHQLARAVMLDAALLEPHVALVEHALLFARPHVTRLAEDVVRSHESAPEAWVMAARVCCWHRDVDRARGLALLLSRIPPRERADDAARILSAIEGRAVQGALEHFAWRAESDPRAARRAGIFRQIEAEVAAANGDLSRALDACESASRIEGFFDIAWLDRCTLLEPMRSSPRFAEVRATVAAAAAAAQHAVEPLGEDER